MRLSPGVVIVLALLGGGCASTPAPVTWCRTVGLPTDPSYVPPAVLVRKGLDLLPHDDGRACLLVTVGEDGTVRDVVVVTATSRALARAAAAAVRQWRFRPATLGGRPVETRTDVTVSVRR